MSDIDSLREAVISEIVLPTLMRLAEETSQPIQATVSIRWRSAWTDQEIRTRHNDQAESTARGEVRVVLKEVSAGNIHVSAESILNGLAPGSGFSGFSLRGKLELGADTWSARVTSHTYRYNVWEWRKEFAHKPT